MYHYANQQQDRVMYLYTNQGGIYVKYVQEFLIYLMHFLIFHSTLFKVRVREV